jgi:hypothetical protein
METRRRKVAWPDDLDTVHDRVDTVHDDLVELLIDVRDASRRLVDFVADDALEADVSKTLAAYNTMMLEAHWLEDFEGALARCIEVLDRK